jgi:hypothetical protein
MNDMINQNDNNKLLDNLINGKNSLELGGVDLSYKMPIKKFDGFYLTENLLWLHASNEKNLNLNDCDLSDIIVPLKIMYDKEINNKNISVSIDPLIPT